MLDAGLESDPKPFAEIPLGRADLAYRRWSAFAQSVLPKMVEKGLPPRRISWISGAVASRDDS
jgi:hypothetical protein